MENRSFLTASAQRTGNLIVMFEPGRKPATIAKAFAHAAGANFRVAHSGDFQGDLSSMLSSLDDQTAVNFDLLGVAVMRTPADREDTELATSLQSDRSIRSARAEYWMFAQDDWRDRYDGWVKSGLQLLAELGDQKALDALQQQGLVDNASNGDDPDGGRQNTTEWGIRETNADQSRYTGKGIKLAVLDTGFDQAHPDFAGRTIISQSFVPGESIQDTQGHGTHCIGTICAGISTNAPRYSVAPEIELHVGKVLNDTGAGQESWVVAGINWAVERGCEVISVSLGRAVQVGEPADPIYEAIGDYALNRGTLVIAAAGNLSARRENKVAPVVSPANSRSIMSVAALDAKLGPAHFSCAGLNTEGGEVNISGPGVDIFSSYPMPRRYKRMSGTSMATPHVAGIAALLAQSNPQLRGRLLWEAIEKGAKKLSHSEKDVGKGLIVAP